MASRRRSAGNKSFSTSLSVSVTPLTPKRPSVSAISWAAWSSAIESPRSSVGTIFRKASDSISLIECAISLADLNQLRLWIESQPEVPIRGLVQRLRIIQDLWSWLLSHDLPAPWPTRQGKAL